MLMCQSWVKNTIIQRNDKVRMFNIHGKDIIGNIENYGLSLSKFYLFSSKKIYTVFYYKCHNRNENRGIFEITVNGDEFVLSVPKDHTFFDVALAYASQYYDDLRHCHLCKYQKSDIYGNKICALYKKLNTPKFCSDNNPLDCTCFKKDLALIKTRIKILEDYKKDHPVLIWQNKI